MGFEPMKPFGLTAFKAVAINHSANPPYLIIKLHQHMYHILKEIQLFYGAC